MGFFFFFFFIRPLKLIYESDQGKHYPSCFICWCLQGHSDILHCQRAASVSAQKVPLLDFVGEKGPEKGYESGDFQSSFSSNSGGLPDPVVSFQAGQVIIKGILPGHVATLLSSDMTSVLTHLSTYSKSVCI